jgi:acyl carrier protein
MLAILQDFWREELDCKEPLTPEARIDSYLKRSRLWDDMDLAEVIAEVEEHFGFDAPAEDWAEFFGTGIREEKQWEAEVGPRCTFGALADFIVRHVPPVSFDAVAQFGTNCATAGAFRGIELVARQIRPDLGALRPSTPIRDRLRGRKLDTFWNRVRWMSGDALPPLHAPWRHGLRRAVLVAFLALLAGLVLSLAHGTWTWLVLSATGFALLRLSLEVAVYCESPLPSGIDTFGDLARLLADKRQAEATGEPRASHS